MRQGLKGLVVFALALLSFVAGSLMTARQARADNDRVFELLVYHTAVGKEPQLEDRFRDARPLISRYMDVVGYWVPNENKPGWNNTFVYLLSAPSLEESKKRWHAMHADPAFQKYVKAEETEKLIESVDAVYMRPTDFSAMR